MKIESVNPILVRKYNQPLPRYTSYPTVPFWQNEISIERWKEQFAHQFDKQNAANGISIYIHLPFCESLCTYCGCNKKITQNHSDRVTILSEIFVLLSTCICNGIMGARTKKHSVRQYDTYCQKI